VRTVSPAAETAVDRQRRALLVLEYLLVPGLGGPLPELEWTLTRDGRLFGLARRGRERRTDWNAQAHVMVAWAVHLDVPIVATPDLLHRCGPGSVFWSVHAAPVIHGSTGGQSVPVEVRAVMPSEAGEPPAFERGQAEREAGW
jgi:hypothetical protein